MRLARLFLQRLADIADRQVAAAEFMRQHAHAVQAVGMCRRERQGFTICLLGLRQLPGLVMARGTPEQVL